MVDIPTPAEAPAQLQGSHDFEDKDPREPTPVPTNIKLLECLRITTASWLKAMKKHKCLTVLQTDLQNYIERLNKLQHLLMLQTDLRKFNKRITEVLSTYTDHNYKWTKKDVFFFDYRCRLMKEKWDHFKLHVKPLIKEDEKENQKPVLVSNFSTETRYAPKKRRWTQHT